MKTRLLLILLLTLFLHEVRAQVNSPLQSLKKVTLFSHKPVVLSGISSVKGELIARAAETKKSSREIKVNTDLRKGQQTQAQVDQLFAELASKKTTATIDGKNLSGATLAPGVYQVKGSAFLKGTLTLKGSGKIDELYIFKIDENLILSPSAEVKLSKRLRSRNIVWVVNGKVHMNAQSTLKGSVLAKGDISAEHGAQVEGRLLSTEGSVSLLDSFASDPATVIADLAVTQTVSAGPYVVGELVTYTITVTNNGPDDEENVYVNFGWLPGSGLLYQTSTPSSGTYNNGDWDIPLLPKGDVQTLVVTLKVNRAGFITTVASITGTGTDEMLSNNTAEFSICAVQPPGEITGPTLACINKGNYVFRVPAVTGAKGYVWTLPSGWTITNGAGTAQVTVSTGTTGGNHIISVQVDSPCGLGPVKSQTVFLYTDTPTLSGNMSGDAEVCLGNTVTYSINSAANTTKYKWTVPGDWTIDSGNDSTEQITVTVGPTSGKVQVYAINPCGNSNIFEKEVEVSPSVPAVPGTISGFDVLCANQTGLVTYSIEPVAGAKSYTWSVPADWSNMTGQGGTSITVQIGSQSGQVTVTADNVCGPSTASVKDIIVSPAAPAIGSINGDKSICSSDASRTYSVAPVANALTYEWSVPTGWTILSAQGSSTITVKPGTTGGQVKLTVTNGCGTDVKTLNVVVSTVKPAAPTAINATAVALAPCEYYSGLVYSVDAVPGAEDYIWSHPAGWMINNKSADGRTITATSSATAGQISVRAINGCGSSETISVNVIPFGSAPGTPSDFTGEFKPCAGTIYTYEISSPIAGLSYNWTVPTDWTIQSGDGTPTLTVLATTTAGSISVTAQNGCGVSSALAKSVSPFNGVPTFSSDIIAPGLICLGVPEITYSIVAASGAQSYVWVVPSGWTINDGQGSNQIKVTPGSTGGQVTVTAINTCGPSETKSVNAVISPATPATPTAITGANVICVGQTTTYTSTASANATSYIWEVPGDWTITSGNGGREITVTIGATSGNVTVEASNTCGTSPAQSLAVQVVQSTLNPGSITGINEVCGVNTVQEYSIFPVTGATGYTWTVPANWEIIEGTGTPNVKVRVGSTGSISVNVQNQCGTGTSTAKTTTVRTQPPATPASITAGTNALFPCENQSGLTYSISPVEGATSYFWSVPSSWTIVGSNKGLSINVTSGVGAGQVTVYAQNACGSSMPIALNIATSDAAPSQPEAILGDPVPCIGATGRTYSVQNAVSGVQYNWSVPANWVITSGLGTSQITVTIGSDTGDVAVAAENGCGITLATTFAVAPTNGPPSIAGDIDGESDICLGADLKYNVPAGAAISSYTWAVPTGWNITAGQGTNEITVKVNAVGTGQVRVSAMNGCGTSNSKEMTVVVSPNVPEVPPTITGPTDLCKGSQYTFLANPVDNATGYQWNIPDGWAIVSGQGTGTLVVTIGSAAGEISVLKSRATNGCGGSEETVFNTTVNPQAPGAVGTISGPTELCAANTEQVYSAIVPFATNYYWTVPADWQIVSGRTGTTLTVIPGTQSGEVRLTTSNACGPNVADGVLDVTIIGSAPAKPVAITGSTNAAQPCSGQTGLTYSIEPVTGAEIYKWEVPSDWTITSGQGTTAITVTAGSLPGDITVLANNLCGDGPASSFAVTPFTAAPATPAGISGAQKPCVGSLSTYRIVDPVPNVTYNWTTPTNWSITSGQGTAEVVFTVGSDAGAIVVTASNGCGPSSPMDLAVTPTNGVAVLTSAINGESTICAGATDLVYSITPVTSAESYLWTLPAGWNITAGNGTNSITVTAGTASGTISVAGVNACGVGVAEDLSVTTISGAPQNPVAINGPADLCAGGGPVTYSIAAVANASSYTWSYPSGWAVVDGQNTLSIRLQPNGTSGDVSVIASNVCGNGTATKTITITPTEPDAAGQITGPASYCADNSTYTYSITPVAGASTYNWTVPTGWTLVSGAGTASILVRPSINSGDITVAAANGCGEGVASSIAITITGFTPERPGAIAGTTVPCKDQTVTYSIAAVAGASTYVWNVPTGWAIISGQNSTSITVTAGTGSGEVTVKASSICGESPLRSLSVNSSTIPPAIPEGIVGDALPCVNSQNVTYSVKNPVAGMVYTWALPAGITEVSGQGTAALVVNVGATGGNITVTATNGCGTSAASTLAVTPTSGSPALSSNISGPNNVCAGTSYSYAVTGSNASSFEWTVPTGWTVTGGAGTNMITVTAGTNPGTIAVSAKNGCAVSTSRSLAVTTLPATPQTPGAIAGAINTCANQELTYEVEAVANATSYIWTVPSGASIIAGNNTRTVTIRLGNTSGQVTVKAENSCGVSTASVVDINVSPSGPQPVGAITGASAICATSTSQTYSIEPVGGATSYNWSFPAGWNITSGQGTVSVEVQPGTVGGTVTITASNACNETSRSMNITLTQPLASAPTGLTGKQTPCIGETGIAYSVNAMVGATSYTWTVPTGWSITNGEGTRSIVVTAGSDSGSITVTANNSCGASPAVSLTVAPSGTTPDQPTAIANASTICANSQQVFSVENPVVGVTYNWSYPESWTYVSGEGTAQLTMTVGTASGAVSVAAQNTCGTSTVISKAVTVITEAPALAGEITGATSNICQGTTQTYSVPITGSASSITWVVPAGWSIISGQGTASVQATAGSSGTIRVSAINGCGQMSQQTLTISVTPGIPATVGPIAGDTGSCPNELQAYSIPALANATNYVWTVPLNAVIQSGQGTNAITVRLGNVSGEVKVSVTDACGNTRVAKTNVELSEVAPSSISAIAGETSFCSTGASQTYSISPVANAKSLTWAVPAGWTILSGQGSTSITVKSNTESGTISVEAWNYCGTSSQSLAITVKEAISTAPSAIMGKQSLCENEVVTYSTSAVTGATGYVWTVPAGWNIEGAANGSSIQVKAGSNNGIITVAASNDCGNSPVASLNVVVSSTSASNPGPITGLDQYCASTTTYTYSIQPVPGVTSYSWTIPAGWTLTAGQGTNEITIRPGATSGLIAVRTFNGCGGSNEESSKYVTITGQTPVAPEAISGTTAPCIGQGNVTYSINSVAGASSYVWTVPGDWTIVNGQGTTSITVMAGSNAGNVSVKATSTSCGDSPAATLAVTPFSNPPAIPQSITGNAAPCTNAITTYAVVNPVAGLTYNWVLPTGWSIASGAGTASIQVNVGASAGQVSVSATNDCGTSTAVNLQVAPTTGTATLNQIIGSANVCPNATPLTYSITPTAGITDYQWSVPTGWTLISGQGTNQVTLTAPTSGSGNLVVNAVNECGTLISRSLVISVTSGAPLAIQLINGNASVCENTEYTYFVPVVTDATTYTWSVPTGATLVSGQGTSAVIIRMGAAAGDVTVFASNDCSASPIARLTIGQPGVSPAMVGAITGETTICSTDASRTYSITAVTGATSYNWTLPTGWTILGGQGTLSLNVKPGSANGIVKVDAINDCGTTSNTLGVTVSQPLGILSAIDGNEVPCENETGITYSISAVAGATAYTWTVPTGWVIQSGQNSSSIEVTASTNSGQITVKASNACGDSQTSSLMVSPTQAAPLAPTGITGEAAPCANSQGIFYSVQNPIDGVAYTWTLPNGWVLVSGQNSPTIEVNVGAAAGNILVTASNGCGTSTAFAFAVTPNTGTPPITGAITGEDSVCGNTTSLTYSVTGIAGATYAWTVPTGWTILSGQNTTSITVKAGSLDGTITVEGSNGCGTITRTKAVTIQDPITATVSSITGNQAPCDGEENLTYTINAVAGATGYTWSVPSGWAIVSGANTNTIIVKAGNTAGVINVFAFNSCGDTPTSELQVTPTLVTAPAGIAGNIAPCANTQQVQYSVQNPVAGTTYTWFVPAGWNIASGQGSAQVLVNVGTVGGSISVTAGNSCGTSAAASLAVTIGEAGPVLSTEVQGSATVCANASGLTYSIAATARATNYTWSVPAGWSISNGQGTTQITVQAGTTAGDIRVVASNNCGTSTKILAVSINNTIVGTPAPIIGNNMVCPASSNLIYSVSAVTGATSYVWNVPVGWAIQSGQGTASIMVTSGTTSGQITVAAVGACATSSASILNVQVTEPVPALGNISGNATTCAGVTQMYSVLPVAGVTTYQWSLPSGWNFVSGQGTNTVTVTTGAVAGTISVRSMNSCMVNPTPTTLAVTVNGLKPERPATITAATTTPCANQTGLVYSISAVAGATDYFWTVPTGWAIVSGQGTTSITATAGTSTGEITVIAKNSCGDSDSRSLTVTPATSNLQVGNLQGPVAPCGNSTSSVTYTVMNVTGASGYTWSVPTGWVIESGAGTASIVVKPSQQAGDVKVVVSTTCGNSLERTLAVNPVSGTPTAPGAITGLTTICGNTNNIRYEISAVTGATSYTWSVPSTWVIQSGQGTTAIIVQIGSSGQVSVVANNNCGASAPSSLAVTVGVALGNISQIQDTSTPCDGYRFSVEAVPGATNYVWTLPAGWQITAGAGTREIQVSGSGNVPVQIRVEARNGTCATAPVIATIEPIVIAAELMIPNTFTPNNDGRNDLWKVRNLEAFPDNELVVINRWGGEVHRQKGYRNDWAGTGLAEGTYYYVLKVRLCGNREETYRGYIMLKR